MRVIGLFMLVSATVGSVFSQKTLTYQQHLNELAVQKGKYYTSCKGGDSTKQYKSVSAAKAYIYTQLIDHIFPAWYGTEWDFNGVSNVPGKGQIACGYFVTTTLKHIGFNLNRYKLAQQYSHSIVNTLCTDVKVIGNNNTTKLFAYINSRPNQLYIVGLDNHVGFISKEKSGIYFIHSSYLDPVAVVKEKAPRAVALIGSNTFVLGAFTENDAIIKAWINNEEIYIKK